MAVGVELGTVVVASTTTATSIASAFLGASFMGRSGRNLCTTFASRSAPGRKRIDGPRDANDPAGTVAWMSKPPLLRSE